MAYNILKTSIVSLMLTLLISVPVLAATDATNLALQINSGLLTIDIDDNDGGVADTATFAAVIVSTSVQNTYTGSGLGNDVVDLLVTADDARGEIDPSGWSVTATVDELVNVSDANVVIPVGNFDANFGTVTAVSGDASGVTAGSDVSLVESGTPGTSNPFTILTAADDYGQGNYQVNMGFDLQVDANQKAGSYNGVVDVTVI